MSPCGSSSNQLSQGPSGLRVEGQVRLRAVLDRRRQHELGVLHHLLLERQDRLDRLVAVLDVPELEDVLAEALLALEQVLDVGAGHLGAAAVAAEDDLVADVDGGEGGARGVDVEQVLLLVRRQRRTFALRAASAVASSMSARSSLRVSSTMKPSPMRVGIFGSTGVPSHLRCAPSAAPGRLRGVWQAERRGRGEASRRLAPARS